LGLLIVALYNSPHRSPLETNTSVSTFKRLFSSSSTVPTQNNNFLSSVALAKPVSNLLARLITRRPAQRLNAREFQQAEYFDNILVSAIRFLESLPTKTPSEKSQFLRGLPRITSQFSSRVLEKKVLPALLEETKDRELIALILQNAFKMIKIMPTSKRVFPERVIPKLREIFVTSGAGKSGPAERDSAREAGLMVLLENIQTISDNTTGKEFKDGKENEFGMFDVIY
jgi:SCY1-like protein 2